MLVGSLLSQMIHTHAATTNTLIGCFSVTLSRYPSHTDKRKSWQICQTVQHLNGFAFQHDPLKVQACFKILGFQNNTFTNFPLPSGLLQNSRTLQFNTSHEQMWHFPLGTESAFFEEKPAVLWQPNWQQPVKPFWTRGRFSQAKRSQLTKSLSAPTFWYGI